MLEQHHWNLKGGWLNELGRLTRASACEKIKTDNNRVIRMTPVARQIGKAD